MRSARWALLLAALLGVTTLEAQRSELPFGLRAGRRDVGLRGFSGSSGGWSIWYPASCGRDRPAPTRPCADSTPDSGRFPLVLLLSTGRPAEDSARAAYFASHAYGVVLVRRDAIADALEAVQQFPFVDSGQIVAFGAAGDLLTEVRAAVILDAGDRVLLSARGGVPLTVKLPSGKSNHVRLVAAIAHSYFDAILGRGPVTLADLSRRLKRSGLDD